MTTQERDKIYFDRLLEFKAETNERMFYSIKKFDTLVVSISGGGIYIVLETLKFYMDNVSKNQITDNLIGLKVVGAIFAAAIILNFWSQWTAHEANRYEAESTESRITIEKNDDKNSPEAMTERGKVTYFDGRVKDNNSCTGRLNKASAGMMLLGVLALIIYAFTL